MSKGYEAVTVESLTDDMVRTLLDEARSAGDRRMVLACDSYLGTGMHDDDARIDMDEAAEIITDAINDARAQA